MFGLGTFARDDDRFAGLVLDGRVHDLRPHCGAGVTTAALLQDWDARLPDLHALAAATDRAAGVPLSDLRPLPPVTPSGQVFCAGANYYTHIVEMSFMVLRDGPGETRRAEELQAEAVAIADQAVRAGRPFVFAGQPGALSGATDDIALWGPGVQHDWELELAVVMGRRADRIGPEDALDHVAGYTICNDVSTRDVMFRPRFTLSDFTLSKNRPTFFPIGPYLVPREFVPDYRELRLELRVNGELMQDAVVGADIIHGVEELVSYVSHTCALFPGDVVLTGSPAGNAAVHGNRWLTPGDVVDAQITGLGRQRNTCVPDPRTTPVTVPAAGA